MGLLKSKSFWRYFPDKLGAFCLLAVKPSSRKRLCVIAVAHPALVRSTLKCLAAINGKKSNFTHSSGFLGDQQPLKMFYFLVYAKPIYIHLVRNSELFGKIFVNENDLCE